MALGIIEYERRWIDGLNRGDVSPADETFAPSCIIHMLIFDHIAGDQVAERWEQWDQMAMLQQLGFV